MGCGAGRRRVPGWGRFGQSLNPGAGVAEGDSSRESQASWSMSVPKLCAIVALEAGQPLVGGDYAGGRPGCWWSRWCAALKLDAVRRPRRRSRPGRGCMQSGLWRCPGWSACHLVAVDDSADPHADLAGIASAARPGRQRRPCPAGVGGGQQLAAFAGRSAPRAWLRQTTGRSSG
jgi:hypothetical protein